MKKILCLAFLSSSLSFAASDPSLKLRFLDCDGEAQVFPRGYDRALIHVSAYAALNDSGQLDDSHSSVVADLKVLREGEYPDGIAFMKTGVDFELPVDFKLKLDDQPFSFRLDAHKQMLHYEALSGDDLVKGDVSCVNRR